MPFRAVTSTIFGLVFALSGAANLAVAESPGKDRQAAPPRYTAHRTSAKIEVDGRLTEADWQNAPTFGDFHFPWWTSGKKEQTTARMLWDDRFLYVAYDCRDAHVSAVETERDSPVYRDDCVELFTAPNPKQPLSYFNIEMNVNGAILDRHHPDGPGKPQVPNWNATGIRIATKVEGTLNDDSDTDRGWVLEVAIPFANFAGVTGKPHPADGDVWHLNLNRLGGKTNPQHSQWSPGRTEKPAFHTPDTFGRVTFSTHTVAEQAVASLAAAGYRPVLDHLQLPDDVTLGRCSAVDINSRGELYLFHRGRKPILCFNAKGEFVRAWGDDLIGMAHGLRIDADDNVWVTDIGHHMVFKFSPAGKLLLALGTSGRPGNTRTTFNKPADIAFGADGEIFVADGYGNSRVVKFDRRGVYITAWGTAGSGPGEFDLPHSIAVDSRGRVLVGDRENDRIQIFGPEGELQKIWTGFAPYGIAIAADRRIYVADGRAGQILRLNRHGKVDQRLGSPGQAPGQFQLPHMLTITADGTIHVAEVMGERLQTLQPIPNATPRNPTRGQ